MATLREEGDDDNSTEARTIRSVAFAPTPMNVRGILAVASFDGTISIWEDFSSESKGKSLQQIETDGPLDLSSNGTVLDRYHDTACGWECTAQLEGHENEVKDVAWNATGTLLASCGRDKSVWIWECFLPGTIGGDGNGSTGQSGGEGDFECLAVLQSHSGDVKSVVFAPSHGQFGDGDEILLSASYDDTIRCWAEDAGDWYCALTLESVHTSSIWTIAMSPGGVRMVSGSADKSIAVWRCYTASEKKEQQDGEADYKNKDDEGMHSDGMWKCVGKLPDAHSQPVYTVDCAPSKAGHGRIVSGGGDDCINVYREVGGTSDAPLFAIDVSVKKAHMGDVNCVKWHPTDGRLIASAGDDGLVKIWNYDL
jgi:WD40 repeat protein|eukprot:scaffold621_cov256-Chaetoceros_neogracile.AAC.23